MNWIQVRVIWLHIRYSLARYGVNQVDLRIICWLPYFTKPTQVKKSSCVFGNGVRWTAMVHNSNATGDTCRLQSLDLSVPLWESCIILSMLAFYIPRNWQSCVGVGCHAAWLAITPVWQQIIKKSAIAIRSTCITIWSTNSGGHFSKQPIHQNLWLN